MTELNFGGGELSILLTFSGKRKFSGTKCLEHNVRARILLSGYTCVILQKIS